MENSVSRNNNNGAVNNNNNSGSKVRTIEELLASKRANVELGLDKATQASTRAVDAVRTNSGKAKRSELRNDLVKSAQLAQVQGEEEGIKQFLSEDIPAVMNALNSELRSSHVALVEANEARLIEANLRLDEASVVDVEWSDYETDYDMSFEVIGEEQSFNYLPSNNPKSNYQLEGEKDPYDI